MKKAALCLIVLVGVGTTLFAQQVKYYNGWYVSTQFILNSISRELWQSQINSKSLADGKREIARQMGFRTAYPTSKLPNSVSQAIAHGLGDYTLDVGDYFTIIIADDPNRPSISYDLYVWITNKNGAYEFYAWTYVR